MAKKKKSSFGLYMVLIVNVAICAVAVYLLTSEMWKHGESRSSYEELFQLAQVQETDEILEPSASLTPLPPGMPPETHEISETSALYAPMETAEGQAREAEIDEEAEEDSFEEESIDQGEAFWLIQVNQPQYAAFGLTPPPVGPAATPVAQSDEEMEKEEAKQSEDTAQGNGMVQSSEAIQGSEALRAAAISQRDAVVQGTAAPQGDETILSGEAPVDQRAEVISGEERTQSDFSAQSGESIQSSEAIQGSEAVQAAAISQDDAAVQGTVAPQGDETILSGEATEEIDDATEETIAARAAYGDLPQVIRLPEMVEEPETTEEMDGNGEVVVRQTPVPTLEPWMKRVVQMDTPRYNLDLPYLQEKYEDVVGWLVQENTKINYPVMQAEDNDYYLNRLYDGRRNDDGSIFLDSSNRSDFSDGNVYIYGHNTTTGDMFGSLAKYKNQDYFEKNPQLMLLTAEADYVIDVFACTMNLVDDESVWRVRQFVRRAEFEEYVAETKAGSFITSDITPEWGDQLVILCTCTNIAHGERYVVYGRMRAIRYGSEESIGITKKSMDERQTENGRYPAGGLGELQVYAQNDPLWKDLRYEPSGSRRTRSFGDGGGAATAVAMVVANMVPEEELTRLRGFSNAEMGYTFCTHSVNQYFCNNKHGQYVLQTPEEFQRYLPLAIANFTTGNNLWEDEARNVSNNGTNMTFLPYIAGIFGFELEASARYYPALEALQQGAMVICVAGGRNSPISSKSQYIVLAGVDDEYMYVLDPVRKSHYRRTDRDRILEVIAPGLVRVKLDRAMDLMMSAYYIVLPPKP